MEANQRAWPCLCSGYRPVVGFCKHSHELLCCIKILWLASWLLASQEELCSLKRVSWFRFWCRLLPGSPLCEPGSVQSQILHMFPHIWLKGSYILSIQQQQKQVSLLIWTTGSNFAFNTFIAMPPYWDFTFWPAILPQKLEENNWKTINNH